MPETVTLTVTDGLAEIVLDAPEKLNALDVDALHLLRTLVSDATTRAASGEIRALLLRGEGRSFCAGRDVAGNRPRA
jgi:2-(1,2-epoxy-1,2-dihydrophenyl)acetyl-CoA isomerase